MVATIPETSQPIPTIVVSRPGIMQQSLRASLAAYPWIGVVASCGDGLTAVNHLTRLRPGLLVIDANLLDEEVDALLVAVRARRPAMRCLVLARSGARKERLAASGADAVILRNGPAQELQEALLQLAQDTIDQQTEARPRGPGEGN